jgi:hypothetical protein
MKLSKRERHLVDLRKYTFVNNEIESYLLEYSNLPGKRGNIELAFSFADYVEEKYSKDKGQVFTYCLTLISENPHDTQVIGNEEFLPFCAIIALGRIGKIDATKEDEVIEFLKVSAKDGRWRIREAVAMAIQELMDVHPKATIEKLHAWVNEDTYLVHRALVAGVAEPRLMNNRDIARVSLEIHKIILGKIAREPAIRDKDYKVLVKGLCYTLSVIITGIEDEGFAYLEALITTEHPIIKKIVRENKKKNRLKRLNEDKVVELLHKL